MQRVALLAALLAVACDDALILPADGGRDAGAPDGGPRTDGGWVFRDSGLGNVGVNCGADPGICDDGLECTRTWPGGVTLACMKRCTDHEECGPGRCIIELGTAPDIVRYCSIPCDPLDPQASCRVGTCTVGDNMGVWGTHCGDWPVGTRTQNALCGPSADRAGCRAGFGCYTVNGSEYHCTAICRATPSPSECPPDFTCNPAGVAEGITYGYCIPPTTTWPPVEM